MRLLTAFWHRFPVHGRIGLLLLLLGESLIAAHARPASDIYFPFVWSGYILVLDAALLQWSGASLFTNARLLFLALFPMSAVFWWVFELLNQVVHNWVYIGAGSYTGLAYIGMASLDFSFVLPAVVTSALVIATLLPVRSESSSRGRLPRSVPAAVFLLGLASLVLSVALPHYFFGLMWISLFFLLDPINYVTCRPSVLEAAARTDWRLPLSFALAALMCGFFWEAWNYWAMPRWVYSIPYVNHWHIFEMPLLGWAGYLPFGLELFAMANFVLPWLGLGGLTLDLPLARGRATPDAAISVPTSRTP